MSIREMLFDFIQEKGLGKIERLEFERLIDSTTWPRALRQLKQDGIISYTFDASENAYIVNAINEYSSRTSRSKITTKIRYRILNRDKYTCQACGKKPSEDGVKLHVDHMVPVDMGGLHNDKNLWTLCSDCNLGKKNFFRDELDSDAMKEVFKKDSGYQRLLTLFEKSPNIYFEPSTLQGIAKIRDWTRTIRNIREKHDLNIEYIVPDARYPNGAYVYKTKGT
jgi:hypothetical protein